MIKGNFKTFLNIVFVSLYFAGNSLGSTEENGGTSGKFIITGSEFYRRSNFDTGQIRIYLENIASEPFYLDQCKLTLLSLDSNVHSNLGKTAVELLYSKLSPPFLEREQKGELLLKLVTALPQRGGILRCTIYARDGSFRETSVTLNKSPVWISYVGFSEDLRKVYVYVQNNSRKNQDVKLLEVGDYQSIDPRSVNITIPPGDKGCLIFTAPKPFEFGQYVNITLSVQIDGQRKRMYRVVRAVNKFPLIGYGGFGEPSLGLDKEQFFVKSGSGLTGAPCVQTMICPEHAHFTHKNAAKKFLDSRYQIFSKEPNLLTQMWICRKNKPWGWYRFGPLADIAVMNPLFAGGFEYESMTDKEKYFHSFFWLASMAKKSVSPGRYIASIYGSFEERNVFVRHNYSADEIRFMVYCAVAGGAKGIFYRQTNFSDESTREDFVQLNRELQQLKPLLMFSEPVDWAVTEDNNYTAKSLLCGDEAILVIIFDRRYYSRQTNKRLYTQAFSKTEKPIRVKVKMPKGFSVCKVENIAGSLPDESWECEKTEFNFTAVMANSAHLYKIALNHK